MSRRSRRRRKGSADGAGWLGKTLILFIVAGLLGAGLLYAAIRSYLHSDAFRAFLSKKASEAARVDGGFTPFRWDGLAVDTAGFKGTGSDWVRELKLEGLHTEIGVGGLRRGVWEISGSRVQRLDITLDARDRGTSPSAMAVVRSTPPASGWLPKEVELKGLDVGQVVVRASLDAGPALASGMRVAVEPAGARNAYRIKVTDGSIQLPFGLLNELRLHQARLRYQDGRVFLHSSDASAWSNARISASGEWDSPARQFVFQGNASDMKCEDLFNETWAKRFTGELKSDFAADNRSGEVVASGLLTLHNGTLTALPVLDALAAYADTRRFRILTLHEARCSWRWKKNEIRLSDLILGSDGLVRLEGSMTIRGRDLDGTFRLGLTPGTLANIPGAETHVFSPGERGLLWTPLRITGTLDNPKEDLTDRLIEAAGLRMFDVIPETGEKVIKFTRSLIGDSPVDSVGKAVDQGTRIIETGAGIVGEVGGVLDGILGGGRRPAIATPPPDETKIEPETDAQPDEP